MRRAHAVLLAGLTLLAVHREPSAAATYSDKGVAVLQALDKITARTWTLDARIGVPVRFGTLEIRVDACRKRPPEEPPESAAFMTIVDYRPNEQPVQVFHGWMFASQPDLSALEHPVYDIIVLDCE